MADTFVSVTFVADELLTSTKMNLLAANQAGFHDGTALGDGIIVTRHVANAASLQLGDHSTSEQMTRYKWIDGRPIYRKFIDLGAGPNSTVKTVAHGIANFDKCINCYGYSGLRSLPVSFSTSGAVSVIGAIRVLTTDVSWITSYDARTESGGIVLEYVKTS